MKTIEETKEVKFKNGLNVINMTPHDIVVIKENGEKMTFPKSGNEARVNAITKQVGEVEGLKFYRTIYGEVIGLPEPKKGVYYIVSAMVFAATERKDVVAPATTLATKENSCRDDQGRILSVPGFITK